MKQSRRIVNGFALFRIYLNPTPFPLCPAGRGHEKFSYC